MFKRSYEYSVDFVKGTLPANYGNDVTKFYGINGPSAKDFPIEKHIHTMQKDGWEFVDIQFDSYSRVGCIIVMRKRRKRFGRKRNG